MALTLQCMCPENVAASECLLTELWWEGTADNGSTGGMSAGFDISLLGGTLPYGGDATGGWSVPMSLDEKDVWDDLYVQIIVTSSLNQLPEPGKVAYDAFTWKIRQVWQCYLNGSPH